MLDLEPIKARLAAATPGPWVMMPSKNKGGLGKFVGSPGCGFPVCEMFVIREKWGEDMRFIANAPADLAALMAEVERLRDFLGAMIEAWDLLDPEYDRDRVGYEILEGAASNARAYLAIEPIKLRARVPQSAEFITNAVDDIDTLVAEVERLRRQRAVDQDQIRSYARALNWYAEPANWVERIDDRGRDKLSFRWADDDGHMARWALSRWQQNEAEKKD